MKLLSSTFLQTWELATAVALLNKVPLCVYIPTTSASHAAAQQVKFLEQFGVDSRSVEIIPIISSTTHSDKPALMRLRDEEILRRADVLVPVSISPTGNMNELLDKQIVNGKDIEGEFQIEYEKRSEPLSYRIDPSEISTSISGNGDSHLIHWTRACNSLWPDERLIDYYRDIIDSRMYPRSAIATLNRIVQSRTIIASKKNMPAGVETVSFSALPPSEAISLMRWRSRHSQMSLEPYGIGITTESALRHGVKEVRYSEKRHKNIRESWLTQSCGKITKWSEEKEYRHLGNLDLKLFAPDELILFCRTESEARSLQLATGVFSLAMTTTEISITKTNDHRAT